MFALLPVIEYPGWFPSACNFDWSVANGFVGGVVPSNGVYADPS